jgi:hypothetical protein
MPLTDSHTNLDLAKILILVLNSLNCMGKQSRLQKQIAGDAIRREEPTDHQNVSEIFG